MINGINHVAVVTSELDRLVSFYRDALGFEVRTGSEWKSSALVDSIVGVPNSAARSVVLAAGNLYLELFQYLSPPTPGPGAQRQPFERGYAHICIDVTDIDAECARLTAAGVRFNRAPPHLEMSGLKAIYGRDPDGNLIELQETLNNSYGISMIDLPLMRRNRPDVGTEQSDLEEIRRKLHLYCRALDRIDEPLLRSLFHPDSQHAHGPYQGPSSDFCGFAMQVVRSLSGTSHHLSNITIDLAGPAAHTEAYFLAVHRMDKGKVIEGYWSAHDPKIDEIAEVGGRYIDRWEKRAGVWKIARRIGVHDWERWTPTDIPAAHARQTAVVSPARSNADPVYRRE
jgi:catechol 2,3-dioxygenase-like lactoylglutathione lyase family enzyme